MPRGEIDEAWIEEAVRALPPDRVAAGRVRPGGRDRRGDRPVARRAGRGGGHRRRPDHATSRFLDPLHSRSRRRDVARSVQAAVTAAADAARGPGRSCTTRRSPPTGRWRGPEMDSLRALAARLDEASATLDRRWPARSRPATRPQAGVRRATRRAVPARSVGPCTGSGPPPPTTGPARRRAAAARLAAAAPAVRGRRRPLRRRPTTPPAAGWPGRRDGRAGPARRARPRPARAGSTRCSPPGAPEGHPVWPLLRRMQRAARRGACAPSSTCTRRRWPPPGTPCAGCPGVRRRLRRAAPTRCSGPGRPAASYDAGPGGPAAPPRRGRRRAWSGGWSRRPATPTRWPTGWRAAGSAAGPGAGRGARLGRGGHVVLAATGPPVPGRAVRVPARRPRSRARVLAVLGVAYDGAETLLRQWAPSLAESTWRSTERAVVHGGPLPARLTVSRAASAGGMPALPCPAGSRRSRRRVRHGHALRGQLQPVRAPLLPRPGRVPPAGRRPGAGAHRRRARGGRVRLGGAVGRPRRPTASPGWSGWPATTTCAATSCCASARPRRRSPRSG